MRRVSIFLITTILSGCAIEGIGFDGRVNAYNNAAQDSREYVALHMSARDAAWYQGWCGVIEPHFRRMGDEDARVQRYCAAMQEQPQNAESIRESLVQDLSASGNNAVSRRNSVVSALGVQIQQRQAQAAARAAAPVYVMPTRPIVNCTTTSFGNTANTRCQ
jgi:hypothetical protein